MAVVHQVSPCALVRLGASVCVFRSAWEARSASERSKLFRAQRTTGRNNLLRDLAREAARLGITHKTDGELSLGSQDDRRPQPITQAPRVDPPGPTSGSVLARPQPRAQPSDHAVANEADGWRGDVMFRAPPRTSPSGGSPWERCRPLAWKPGRMATYASRQVSRRCWAGRAVTTVASLGWQHDPRGMERGMNQCVLQRSEHPGVIERPWSGHQSA